jgi:hypothetical protein
MGAPDANEKFGGIGGALGEDWEDDPNPGNLPAPGISSFMVTNYRTAFIEVVDDLAALDIRDDVPFVHNLEEAQGQDYMAIIREVGNLYHDVPSLPRFWVTLLFAAYEGPSNSDNDKPQPEVAIAAGATPPSPNDDDGPCVIFYETIRDYRAYRAQVGQPVPVAETKLVDRTIFHESAHRFDMDHPKPPGNEGPFNGFNNAFGTDEDNMFNPAQLDVIRKVIRPNSPEYPPPM